MLDLSRFAGLLREIPNDDFGPARLNKMLEEVRFDPGSVARHMLWKPTGYSRNLVYADARFELLVLCWNAGSASQIHDHAGQQCWFVAHSGAFKVDNYERVSGGHTPGHAKLRSISSAENVTAGMPDYRAEDFDIHKVSVDAGSGPAVSIHVYTKPLSTCLVFDEGSDTCSIKQIGYDNLRREQILVA